MYREGIWFFLVVGFIAFGFDLAAIWHMPKLTAHYRSARLVFTGKLLGRSFLLWIAWNARNHPGHLSWEFWLVTTAAVFSAAGMAMAAIESQRIPYGRRCGDYPQRRRDD